jgi:hypothetical protein
MTVFASTCTGRSERRVASSAIAVAACCLALVGAAANAQLPEPPGQVAEGETPVNEAYLFAHMTHADYGRLYYSVSLDGLHWRQLNRGRRVSDEYRGHPDICRGHDGRFYLVGNRRDRARDINIWASDDLIEWQRHNSFEPDLSRVPDYSTAIRAIGAPKLFYDEPSRQYVVTWHTPHEHNRTELPEPYWVSQRTLYVTSPDLKTLSDPPRRLFDWDMATIDVILRHVGEKYFAIIKDERYATLDWPTGKTIRICSADNLLGPYTPPGPSISPSFREAPALIPAPNGQAWYLYYEQYPGVSYGLSVSDRLDGAWFQVSGVTNHADWDKYELPRTVRHGCMLAISRAEYDALVERFGLDVVEESTESRENSSP